MDAKAAASAVTGAAVLAGVLGVARGSWRDRTAALALAAQHRSGGQGWRLLLGRLGRLWLRGSGSRLPVLGPRHPRPGVDPSAGQARLNLDLERRLSLAGATVPVEAMAGGKVVLGAAGLLTALLLASMAPIGLVVAPIGAVLGYRVPDIALARRARHRQSRMAAQVVDLVELLCATTEAGLGPSEALRRSTGALSGPLGAELHAVVGRIELGQPWRAAFEELVGRVEIPSLRRLSIALARSNRLGTSLRAALRTVAQDLRDERRLRAEEAARRAPVKMLFPLVLLILPAFLLLTVGPVLLATIRSLDSG